MIAPVFVPALKMPVANARSFLGNHSATALMAPGKFADSATPSNARAAGKRGRRAGERVPDRSEAPRDYGRREPAPHADPVEQPPRREESEGVGQGEPRHDVAIGGLGPPELACSVGARIPSTWRST